MARHNARKEHHARKPPSSSHSIRNDGHGDPDVGPPMHEGAHHFDKGYESDADVFKRKESYPGDHERGNHYKELNREIITRDSAKLRRSHFTKIA